MLFSSLQFLYLFLPCCLFIYYLCPRVLKNYFLLFASLIFFAWGGVSLTGLLLVSIAVNYCFGRVIENYKASRYAYWWLSAGVTFNLILLGTYKYADFIVGNINAALDLLNFPPVPLPGIALPLGISFYTFHAISYIVDIYRGKTPAQKNPFYLALYICMFSQLIAGPIIRYHDVWKQLAERQHLLSRFSSGVERFCIGLARKVLLANALARVADSCFARNPSELGGLNAWLGIIAYALQLYHDFAGYSDMAIGLGRMFGFEFMENFNFPYISRSITEFWRRWHISLSGFFRDYVYFPLGGNRKGTARTYLNLFMVFLLIGFWHGASWNFVIFGLVHGTFMVGERLGIEKFLTRTWRPVASVYFILAFLVSLVIFRSGNMEFAGRYLSSLFDFHSKPAQIAFFRSFLTGEFFLVLAIAILGSTPFFHWLFSAAKKLSGKYISTSRIAYPYHLASAVFYAALLFLSTLYLSAGSYNPFIYFRF